MNTQNNNRVIAEFLELPKKQVSYGEVYVYEDWNYVNREPHHYQDFELLFHLRWDWLMPVVEKIAKMVAWTNEDGTTDTFYPRTFGMIDGEGNFMVRINANTLHHDATLIGATYKAVVDFITYHNENNTTT